MSSGEIRQLIINIPPRCAKSLLICVFWPCWAWINRPSMRWMFASYALNLSIRDSVKCRNVIQSPWYQARWADRYQICTDQNAKTRFETDKTGMRLATSVGSVSTAWVRTA